LHAVILLNFKNWHPDDSLTNQHISINMQTVPLLGLYLAE